MSLANVSGNMDETMQYIYKEVVQQYVPSFLLDIGYTPWVFSLLGSALIGLSGILPLFVIPNIGDGKEQTFNRKYFVFFKDLFYKNENVGAVVLAFFLSISSPTIKMFKAMFVNLKATTSILFLHSCNEGKNNS